MTTGVAPTVVERTRRTVRAASRIAAAGAAGLLLAAAACGGDDTPDQDAPPVLAFASAPIRLVAGADTIHLLAELAESRAQQTLGLMERRHLADSAGMLFIYSADQPDTSGFWMHRTRIPLDIAFADSTGVVRSIQHMVPCPTELSEGCPAYPAGATYRAALEVNAGYFARHNIDVGSRILLGDTARTREPERI